MAWRVGKITDKGRGHHYRWHISGVNFSNEMPTEFHWNVPDLSDARYYLSENADAETEKLFRVAVKSTGVRE